MSYVVRVPLEDGESVLVEVEGREEEAEGWTRVGRAGDAVRSIGTTLQEALAPVRPAIRAIVEQVRDGIDPPDRVAVEFGVKLVAEAGVVVARHPG
ncbi:CU044_2847 family protein [Streptomyces sp. URMC 123]|uniref:CU044_2847 family protein n=1 Tax=Streptomyces sp. URMC 123 TaxID=3423403 RepID=UPI003F1A7830